MPEQNDKYWFRAKTYGWGWGFPVRWQGWVVLLAYIILAVGGTYFFGNRFGSAAMFLYLAMLTLVLVGICWRTGEPPKWRWDG